MKKLLLFLLFLSPFFSFAQSPNFFVDGARWVYSTIESQEPGQEYFQTETEVNTINGDTVINFISYKKLYTNKDIVIHMLNPCCNTYYMSQNFGPQFLRYDSSSLQVYFKDSATTAERLIYDFNLSVGDTVPMKSFWNSAWDIDSIANILFFGYPVRKYYLTIPGDNSNYIIDGMGGANGLSYCQTNEVVISGGIFMTTLDCFQLGDSIYSPTGSCPSVTNIQEADKTKFSISPNPAHTQFTISFNQLKVENGEMKVYDMMGRVVMEENLTPSPSPSGEGSTVSLHCEPGIYFVRVSDGNKTAVQKLVVE